MPKAIDLPAIGEKLELKPIACPECGRQTYSQQNPGPCVAVSRCGRWLAYPLADAKGGGCDAARSEYRLAHPHAPSVWRVGSQVDVNVYCDNRPMFMARTSEDAARMVALLNLGEAAAAADPKV